MTRARDASTPISRRRLLVGGGVLAGSAAVGAVALRTADPFYANVAVT